MTFKEYLDTVNRTGTLRMSDIDFTRLNDRHLELFKQKVNGYCKTCIIEALKRVVRHDSN